MNKMPRDKLKVLGMIFHAYHGLYDDERENGQRFEVDVEMTFDMRVAAKSDKLSDTVDVRLVYADVKKIIAHERFFLIEKLGEKIASQLLQNFAIESVTVRLRKPFAPLGGLANGTEIEIFRQKPDV